MLQALGDPRLLGRNIQGHVGLCLIQDIAALHAAAPEASSSALPARSLSLLQALLYHRLNTVFALEPVLMGLRRGLLQAAYDQTAPSEAQIALAEAFARHAFTNEYLWPETPAETAQLETVQARIETTLASGGALPALALFALGAYRPLLQITAIRDWVAALAQQAPEAIDPTLHLTVLNPLIEDALAPQIEAITAIEDQISCAVRSQYEENPYPRWRYVPHQSATTLTGHIARNIAPNGVDLGAEPLRPKVLVAGCGTGQHPISRATQLPSAAVLALDLSRASLAYAQREALMRGVENLSFAQADILQLSGVDAVFDLIESVGVLHHMHDPEAGLKALVAALRPGGFLRLGLYSAAARQSVCAARQRIADAGYSPDLSGIRAFRAAFAAHETPELEPLAHFTDFYSTSELRDLVFHAQEHQFTLPALRDMLARNGLVFLGFTGLSPQTRARYAQDTPQDPAQTDLDGWAKYEARHPETFKAMYNFYCRKG